MPSPEPPPFEHQRHKQPLAGGAQELVLACPPLHSNINLSRIVRTAGCLGVRRIIVSGPGRVDRKIARDGADQVEIEVRRSLAPVLKKLREDGRTLVGLEQASGSQWIHDYAFPLQSVLVLGHERLGIETEILRLLHAVVEIPIFGLPHSLNVATAASMAMYEYCRQHAIAGLPPTPQR